MRILCIETSTDACSAAVTCGGVVMSVGDARLCRLQRSGSEHARLLPLFVDELLGMLPCDDRHIDAVAVSAGPGSYTGLRIGASFAKGLAYGMHVPLVAVPTLQLMAAVAHGVQPAVVALCPMMDARRMEVYTAVYDNGLAERKRAWAEVVTEDSFAEERKQGPVIFFGNGMPKCRELLEKKGNALFIEDIVPDAAYMGALAEKRMCGRLTEDVAYWTPFYLKEFEAKHSVVKGL